MAEIFLKFLSVMLLLFSVSHPTGLFFRGAMDLKWHVKYRRYFIFYSQQVLGEFGCGDVLRKKKKKKKIS